MVKNLGNRYTITLDDDPSVHRLIEKSTGIRSLNFPSVEALLAEAPNQNPMAAFIDIHLGAESSGLNVIPILRGHWPFCALLVVTSNTTDEALSEALAAGADDFIRKPIRPKEIMARLQSRLGDLAEKEAKNILRIGDVTFHVARKTIKGKRGQAFLSPIAAILLSHLIQSKGMVLHRKVLKHKAWGKFVVSDNALDRKMHEIRAALQEISDHVKIKTTYGLGFAIEVAASENSKTNQESSGDL